MPDVIEPYGEEAKNYVETRLLQKNVNILVESVTGQGSGMYFFVTILHPNGNISELLLAEGLAKIVDWNLSVVKDPKSYREAEQRAKAKKLRVWKEFEKGVDAGASNVCLATVQRIVGPEMIIVEPVGAPGTERKISFSSLRGPKRQKNDQGFDVGYYSDTIEFLRKRLVGSKCTVKIDYIKPAEGEYERRECATVIKNDKNIGELLVQNGLATVIKHKKDDNNRSSAYDALLRAEEEAIKEEKGIHSSKELAVHRFVDLSGNASKAKTHLTQLQRHDTIKAIVEYVSSGSRFKIHVPSQNCKFTFVLSGIRTPKASGSNQKGEPFGDQAAKFSASKVLQRDVEIKVEAVDKVGGFIGTLYVNISGKNYNLAELLLEEGLSTVHEYSASQSGNANALFHAEETAKKLRKNLWTNFVEDSVEVPEEPQVSQKEEGLALFEVVISEIGSNGTLFLQKVGPNLKQLELMMGQFSTFHNTAGQQVVAPFTPKAGDYCSAQFSEDKKWYRARVQRVNGVNSYSVTYIDYGNSETVPGSRLRPLPQQFSVQKLQSQAMESKLAYIDLASEESDYSKEAMSELIALVKGRQLAAHVVGKPHNGITSVVIYGKTGSGIESVNEKLVQSGLASVNRSIAKKFELEQRQKIRANASVYLRGASSQPKSELQKLMDAQEEAKSSRMNIWQYGDFTQDDD
jgi:staphylococcal nuclease domain-containing protein 1